MGINTDFIMMAENTHPISVMVSIKSFSICKKKLYRIQDPQETIREKIGTCIDAVVVMKSILDEINIKSKIWLLFHTVKKVPHTILTFEAEEKLVYLELTPQSNKLWYGKEILYENEHSFVDSFQKDDFTIIEITNQIIIGSHPDSLLQHLPQQY